MRAWIALAGLAAAVGVATGVHADDRYQFVSIKSEPSTAYFINIDKITMEPATVKFWTLVAELKDGHFKYFQGLERIDCKNDTETDLYLTEYDDGDNLIGRGAFSGATTPIIPSSVFETIEKVVCGKTDRSKYLVLPSLPDALAYAKKAFRKTSPP